MSAGNRVRGGGYAYSGPSFHSTRTDPTVGAGERFTLVLVGAFVMMTVALLTNEVVATALGRLVAGAWSEIARFVLHVISGGAV
jgi:hypothetical protein